MRKLLIHTKKAKNVTVKRWTDLEQQVVLLPSQYIWYIIMQWWREVNRSRIRVTWKILNS